MPPMPGEQYEVDEIVVTAAIEVLIRIEGPHINQSELREIHEGHNAVIIKIRGVRLTRKCAG